MLTPGVNLRTRQVTAIPALSKRLGFPVASIDLSRADVRLPYGIPRRINGATLKRIAGGHRSDTLLKKTSAGWQFVADDTMIDITDRSVEFKVGRLTIFS